jgi:hypothetical protein
MTGEDLLHQFLGEAHILPENGGVHYRSCAYRGQPHDRPDEPSVWMATEAIRAFLVWTAPRGSAILSWAIVCLQRGRLQEASPLVEREPLARICSRTAVAYDGG